MQTPQAQSPPRPNLRSDAGSPRFHGTSPGRLSEFRQFGYTRRTTIWHSKHTQLLQTTGTISSLNTLWHWALDYQSSRNAIAAGVEAGLNICTAQPEPANAALSSTGDGRSTVYG
ncbi:hypothetical protein CORC01_02034 [Colletotrichum orchidophilum]|uniref:Uncharacterized protein n=1 Tax=Colletotrichum orchidophilum TaxID=1209926 RepID=A0A1G4BMV4_9PEZI|nr:uncharacterized protein CORC01_02034 [Colletotrichum orchidophilum]OHF02638.1 hypothetical protein CORC01_02034 [Colletotrichum orchidophilum]